jgi:peptidoglycan/xylan/chitin deacetylase (PgdA/CDA1 family)
VPVLGQPKWRCSIASKISPVIASASPMTDAVSAAGLAMNGEYDRVYHHHVRKTAGTSLNAAFWALGGLDLHSMGKSRDVTSNGLRFVRFDPELIASGEYFFANSHLPAYRLELPPRTFTVTILRDPVARVVSLYRYLVWVRANPGARQAEPMIDSLQREAAALEGGLLASIDRAPPEYLLRQLSMFSERMDPLEAAENVLGCDAVCFTETFPEDLEAVSRALGLELRELHERRFGAQVSPTEEERDRLLDRLAPEYAMIDCVRREIGARAAPGFHVVRPVEREESLPDHPGGPKIVHRGAGKRAEIALTFDDGPSRWTKEVAAAFEAHDCRATFFLRGRAVEELPDAVAALSAAGHELGNHLWSHSNASTQGATELREEIVRTADAIEAAGAPRPRLLRPPYFSAPRAVAEAAAGTGAAAVVLRSIGSSDWEAKSAGEVVGPVLANARPGDIVCLHDGISSDKRDSDSRRPTVDAVQRLVPALLERGLRPVTVSALLR